MERQIFGEFMGTMVLILMGNGVVANVNLKKSYAQDAGWMVIATGWALLLARSGVSLDDEMVNLMQVQHAFEALSRVITTGDSMLTTLMSIKQ